MKVLSDKEPIDVFKEASDLLYNAVVHTLGPNGTNTAVQNTRGFYEIINDGKSIIEKLTSDDACLAPALETLKVSSFETNKKAGDGTTSTVILMHELLNKVLEYMKNNNIKPVQARMELEEARDNLIKSLNDNLVRSVEEDDYRKVAEIALGGKKYSEEISEVFKFLSKGQRPTLVRSDVNDIVVEKKDGLVLNKTTISSDLFLRRKELNGQMYVALVYQDIDRFTQLTNLIKKSSLANIPTLLFYREMSVDVIENLMLNFMQERLNIIPIRLGAYASSTYDVMKAISSYTKAPIVDGINVTINPDKGFDFGYITYSVLDKDYVLIKNDNFEGDFISESDNIKLENKSVIMRVGGSNEIEREEVYKRIEDAINSLGNAIEFGVVDGAGQAYVQAFSKSDCKIPTYLYSILASIQKILDENGVQASSKIIDSAKVVEQVIYNAFTVIAQVITTERIIHENVR